MSLTRLKTGPALGRSTWHGDHMSVVRLQTLCFSAVEQSALQPRRHLQNPMHQTERTRCLHNQSFKTLSLKSTQHFTIAITKISFPISARHHQASPEQDAGPEKRMETFTRALPQLAPFFKLKPSLATRIALTAAESQPESCRMLHSALPELREHQPLQSP